MRRKFRKDSNQQSIVNALKKIGASVVDASNIGGGFPDLIIGYHKKTYLIEIKNKDNWYGKRGGSTSQKTFRTDWKGDQIYTFTDVEQIIELLNKGLK